MEAQMTQQLEDQASKVAVLRFRVSERLGLRV